MSVRKLTKRPLTQAIVLTGLALYGVINAQAAEQRCAELGSSCICSEPLQPTSLTQPSPEIWNPNDSTSQQCSIDSVAGGTISRAGGVIISTDTTVLAALPAKHSVVRFIRGQNNHQGVFYVGNNGSVSSSFVRLAARWYVYRSSDFEFQGEGLCNNSKIAQFDNGSLIDGMTGGGTHVNFHTYNYTTFTPSVDCCTSGPGPNSFLPASNFKGKWWRYEAVLTNRNVAGYRVQFFGKNITDNGPELTIIDLWNDPSVSKLTPPSLMSTILSNNHRFSGENPDVCNGWIGISHYMMAGWTTNAGQRIGAAKEVEPGALPAPANLKVSQLIDD